MIQVPSWVQDLSGRPGRLGASAGLFTALGILSVGAAWVITRSPRVGFLMAGVVVAYFVTEYVLPPTWATSVPLIVLFVTPGDALSGLSDHWRGLFVLAGGTFLAMTSFLRGRVRFRSRVQLTFPALAAMYLAFFAIHVSKGSLRGGTFWIAGVALWIWLDGRIAADPAAARRGIENGIILIGAISGGIGFLEFLGFIDPTASIPGLEPSEAMFTREIGSRVAGLSGHPLCLGTLCMLGFGLVAIRLMSDGWRLRGTPWIVGSLVASGVGLIVSGARGSWLALLFGLALVFVAQIRSRRMSGSAVIRGSILVVAIAGLVMLSGFGFIVRERLVGEASAPRSFGQRVIAVQTIVDSLPELPLLGVGAGGTEEFMVRGGALIPNIENEYLIALVLGGPIAMLGLITFSLLVVRRAFFDAIATSEAVSLALCGALSLNLATFNFFSWPIAPPLLATVTCLAVLARQDSAGSSGESPA